MRKRCVPNSATRESGPKHMKTDVAIIGGGFAGTSAAITLARANRSVVLVDSGKPRNRYAEHAHGILGFDAASPSEMLDAGHREFLSFCGKIVEASATSLTADVHSTRANTISWQVVLSNGEMIHARQVLVATGIADKLPAVSGLHELWGSRIFHCPYCHGYEIRKKKLVVVGGENPGFTFRITKLLSKWTGDITFYPNGLDLSEQEQDSMERLGITIDPHTVRAVSKTSQYEAGITVQTDAREIDYEACFTGPDFMPNDGLLRDAGCAVDGGWVITEAGKTSQNGIWAAGNVISSPDQIPQAMGAGAAVAIKIDQYMFDQDLPVID